MAANKTLQIPVHILDKEYTIACPESERQGLLESARILNDKMREIRSTGKVIGSERIAVLAALNITHELLQQKHNGNSYTDDIGRRLQRLQARIENALDNDDQQLRL
ncbi:MAG: cell division protein ZapA [Thiohalomonadaceae bacterium]|jgi:cell division protein ZapA